jgi:hypothetical protein
VTKIPTARDVDIRKNLMSNPKVREATELLAWLSSPNAAGSGRTTALALSFLQTARYNPDAWIPVFDHRPGQSNFMVRAIERLVAADPGLVPIAATPLGMRKTKLCFRNVDGQDEIMVVVLMKEPAKP